jgi:hypothetical protein
MKVFSFSSRLKKTGENISSKTYFNKNSEDQKTIIFVRLDGRLRVFVFGEVPIYEMKLWIEFRLFSKEVS